MKLNEEAQMASGNKRNEDSYNISANNGVINICEISIRRNGWLANLSINEHGVMAAICGQLMAVA